MESFLVLSALPFHELITLAVHLSDRTTWLVIILDLRNRLSVYALHGARSGEEDRKGHSL